ncbi:hypothetical protein ARMGADRAFT_1111100 [Armillaria gallica]|uniref:Uncharacterized protein n=1 Tax=Armillaria gallica TaxID=47427 RepID=A0A2H3DA04_ARMGA|nr:hypothetical protein ARMGADRAFT_1111100 [Armillaria gallica]
MSESGFASSAAPLGAASAMLALNTVASSSKDMGATSLGSEGGGVGMDGRNSLSQVNNASSPWSNQLVFVPLVVCQCTQSVHVANIQQPPTPEVITNNRFSVLREMTLPFYLQLHVRILEVVCVILINPGESPRGWCIRCNRNGELIHVLVVPVANEVDVIPWVEDNAHKVASVECLSIDRMQKLKEEHAPNACIAHTGSIHLGRNVIQCAVGGRHQASPVGNRVIPSMTVSSIEGNEIWVGHTPSQVVQPFIMFEVLQYFMHYEVTVSHDYRLHNLVELTHEVQCCLPSGLASVNIVNGLLYFSCIVIVVATRSYPIHEVRERAIGRSEARV